MQTIQTNEAKTWFLDLIHEVLGSLYDPLVLHKSPLVQMFGLEQRRDIVSSLRHVLSEAIASLRPDTHIPRDSKVWRTYHILQRRYVEQVTQREMALEMGLSIRQLQRDEIRARETLADYLWDSFNLEAKTRYTGTKLLEDTNFATNSPEDFPSREQELEYLRTTTPEHATDVDTLICEALKTVQPLFVSRGTKVDYTRPETHAKIYIQPPILRQALINLLSMALHCVPNNQVHVDVKVDVKVERGQLGLEITSCVDNQIDHPDVHLDNLEIIQTLIELCGGQVEISIEPDQEVILTASVTLPVEPQSVILVIDDNADTRQLLQRYLSGTHYRYIGVSDCQQGLAVVLEQRPTVIVLDVMMPGQDGWALLSQLREHPETNPIPVIVCTILAQEKLAFALGAAEFMRKPISRDRFLSTLDHQLELLAQESC